ncbi:MAG: hypothetical protein AMJ90_04510 [candidate division Zixibacteria bacterium SM23_73_2]|nr:MAG: hypothetical protein AMJ90_04510 [candidate division Zixibacteria bacterium SM23_73_2]
MLFFLINIIYWTALPVGWKNEEEKASIIVRKGESLSNVAGKLKGKGLGFNRTIFLEYSKILGFDKRIHVGKYEFQKGNTLYQILSKLRKGKVTPIDVTIPEGLNFKQIAGILQNRCGTDSSLFVAAVTDKGFIKEINILAENLEGYLYPNTYKLYWGIEPYDVAQIMVDHLKGILVDTLKQKAGELGFSVHQVIILASLIESEARKPEERTTISAVYHNRLKKGMLLQCDPTVIYALPDLDRPLLLKDLEIDSPYNTYIYPGLPPGPINNPGKKSILAALYPANVNFLYFVAKGDGSHVFSSTLEEHNRAIRRIKNQNSYESRDRSG